MLVWLLICCLAAPAVLACDPSQGDAIEQRLCRMETKLRVMEQAVQELMQRTDITLDSSPIEKRKNEFIRFGKRADEGAMGMDLEKRKNEFIRFGKRKNEFIRFGKRKNEFIRFGRSDPLLAADESSVEKRKNEFIRFG